MMNEHIRLAIGALQHLKDEHTHAAALTFRDTPERLMRFGDAATVMERLEVEHLEAELAKIDAAMEYLEAQLAKIDAAMAYLRGLED
jgi:uncharacterized protein (DUF1786 family)